jgi:hypothetical protein
MYDTGQGGAANFKWIMCFKPARDQVGNTQPTPDQTALQAACNQLTSAGVIFDVILWQEPNGASSTYFTDGAAYRAYVEFYRPYVPAGIHVIYDCAGSASPGDQQSYFPGNSLVQKVYVDFYGNHYANNLAAGRSDPLATLNNLAISNGVPFGLGEWGYGLSADNALTPTSSPTAGAYVAYLIGVFTARLNAGKTNGAIVYYDGTNPADTWNIIPGPTDWRVGPYQGLYNALASGNG